MQLAPLSKQKSRQMHPLGEFCPSRTLTGTDACGLVVTNAVVEAGQATDEGCSGRIPFIANMALCHPELESRIVVKRFDYLVAARICRASPSKQAVFQSSNNVARCFRKNSIAGRFHPSTFSMIPKHASCRATAATLRLPGLLGPKRPAHARPL